MNKRNRLNPSTVHRMASQYGMAAVFRGRQWRFWGNQSRQLIAIADRRHLALPPADFEAFLRGHVVRVAIP